MKKVALHAKNQHPTFKIIFLNHFALFSYLGFLMRYHFQKELRKDIPEWKEYICIPKISILTLTLSILEP